MFPKEEIIKNNHSKLVIELLEEPGNSSCGFVSLFVFLPSFPGNIIKTVVALWVAHSF